MYEPRRLFALVAVLVIAACGGDDGPMEPEPVVLDRIEMEPLQAALYEIGASLAFEAGGFTSAGAPVEDLSFTWETSNPAVAEVDPAGLATATGFGTAVIRASADGVTGQATMVVRDCSEAIQLTPGEWTSLPVPQPGECGVVLPSGDFGDRYRVAVVRTSGLTCASPNENCGIAGIDSVTVTVNPIGFESVPGEGPVASVVSPAGAPPRSIRRRATPAGLLEAAATARRTDALHRRLRADERELAARLKREGRFEAAVAPALAQAPGAQADLPDRITLDNSTAASCAAGDEVVGLKIYEDERFAFYQDSVQRETAGLRVTETQARRMADFYRDYGGEAVEAYFDGISDIDGNGKVIVFFSPMVTSGTAAFVWSGDFFTESACPASNTGEYIYFAAGLTVDQEEDNWQSLETLVHEMKHISSLKKSVDRPRSFDEIYHPSWIEEGTAEIAANVASRRAWAAVGGPAQNARADGEVISDTGFEDDGSIKPEFYGMAIRMVRTQGYLASQPNAVTVNPLGADGSHSVYGSGYHFHRWLGDAYAGAALAPGGDASFFADQNASDIRPGLRGLETLLGKSFPDLVTEYAAAVMLNDDRIDVPVSPISFTTIDFASSVETFCFSLSPAEWQELRDGQDPGQSPPCYDSASQAPGPDGTYPWPVTASGGFGTSVEYGSHIFGGDIGNGGLRIHDLTSTGQGVGVELQAEVERRPGEARLVVVRIN